MISRNAYKNILKHLRDVTIKKATHKSLKKMKKYYILTAIATLIMVMNALAQKHSVGEKFGGGIVFYVDNSAKHGLITAMADQKQASWSDAIKECIELRDGGFDDWRLPSASELALLNTNEDSVAGGFNPYFYWSSSGKDSEGAFAIAFIMDVPDDNMKKESHCSVRAVRSF